MYVAARRGSAKPAGLLDGRFGVLATNVADSAKLSIAAMIGDIYLAEIDRDVRALREVESAAPLYSSTPEAYR